jgi:hypothetical protein
LSLELSCGLSYGQKRISQEGGAPLLRRGGTCLERVAHLLIGGSPSFLLPSHLSSRWILGEVAALYQHLAPLPLTCGVPSSPLGVPSSHWELHPMVYIIKNSPLAKLVGAWVILLVDVIVIFISHWNKKALEATTWCKAILCGSSMFNLCMRYKLSC